MIQTIKNYINQDLDVLLFDEVDSTNNICKELGKKEFKNTLVLAKSQTAGRGRLGRTFISKKEKGIYMSLLLNCDISINNISKITCVVGTSIVKVLKEYINDDLYIKWVNDIYLNDFKICGILTESLILNGNVKNIVIGIGLNLEHQDFPADVVASSIYDQTGIKLDKYELVGKITNQILSDLSDVNNLAHVDYFKNHLYMKNEMVELLLQNRKYIGKINGINDDFNLLVEVKGEIKTISSGEILRIIKIKEE